MSIKAVTAGFKSNQEIWYMSPEGTVQFATIGKEVPYPYFYSAVKPSGQGVISTALESVRILHQNDIEEARMWKVEVATPQLVNKLRIKGVKLAEDDISDGRAWLERRLGADGDIEWVPPQRVSYMDIESNRKTSKLELVGSVLDGKYEAFKDADSYFQAMEGSKVAASTAWNGKKYDFKILGNEGNVYWGYMAHLDSMDLYSKFTVKKTKRALAIVARREGVGVKLDPFTTDPLVYNENDCRIMEAIIKKKDLIGTNFEVGALTGILPHPDNLKSIAEFEGYLMRNRKKFNLWLEGGHGFRPKTDKIKGALVLYGEPGMYNDVVVGDFTSLYPNTIIYGKYKGNGETVWGVTQQLAQEWVKQKAASAKGTSRREAFKVLANGSGYGVFASNAFRYSNKEIASFVTASAREKLMEMRAVVEEMGFKPLFSDTDSCAVQVPKGKADALLRVVNKRMAPFVVAKECYGQRLLLFGEEDGEATKKHYAILTDEGELIVKGLESVRNDRSPWVRDMTEKLLKVLLTCPPDQAREMFMNAVQSEKETLLSGKVPVEEVALTKSVDTERTYKVKPQHVRVFESMTDKNEGVVGFVTYWVTGKGKKRETFARDGKTDEEIAAKLDWRSIWEHQAELVVKRLASCYTKPAAKLELWLEEEKKEE